MYVEGHVNTCSVPFRSCHKRLPQESPVLLDNDIFVNPDARQNCQVQLGCVRLGSDFVFVDELAWRDFGGFICGRDQLHCGVVNVLAAILDLCVQLAHALQLL